MTKTVFITGSSTGIGKATALYFQEKGWNVSATMRTPSKEQELTQFKNVICPKLDVTDVESIKNAIKDSMFENLWVIPADLSARQADIVLDDLRKSKKRIKSIINQLNDFDIVILDCPPGITLLHENIFAASNTVLMPNIPTTLSIRSFDTIKNYFKENDLDLSIIKCFFSMVDHRKNLHHEIMQQFYSNKIFLKNYIPYLSDVEKMGIHQQPLFEFANSSYAASCFRDLWKEIKKTCIQ